MKGQNMKPRSHSESEKAELAFKLYDQVAPNSGTRGLIVKMFGSRSFRTFTAVPIILTFLLSQTVFASEFCTAKSAIDQGPFFIGQTYRDILNRDPDAAGQKSWVAQLQDLNGRVCKSANPTLSVGECEWNNKAQITLEFLASPESVAKNGSITSNEAFVTALYKILLRRTPDEAGLKSHLSVLGSGGTRLNVVSAFLSSDDYRRRFTCTSAGTPDPLCRGAESVDPIPSFVAQTHRDILGRDPDAVSLASWTTYMTSNQVAMCQNVSATAFSVCDRVIEAQMIMNALNGDAYQKSNPPIVDNKAFVAALYKHLLQRAPDEAGLQSRLKYLSETNDRLGTIYSFLNSDEYRKRFTCYAGPRDYTNLGINGHPIAQLAYSDSQGVSFDDQLTEVHNAGAQLYRFDVSAPGTGADFTKTDALVNKAQAHGVHLLPVLFAVIDLAHDSPTTIYAKSRDGAYNFVSRYKSSIHVWELSNEQDAYSGFASGELITDYDPQKYAAVAAMLRGLSDGVRAADGGALRIIDIAGWLHTGFLQRIEDDRIPYDIVGIHWYQTMGEITCPGQPLPCPANPLHFNVIQRTQTITHGKPMWMTETNYTPLSTDSVEANMAKMKQYLTTVLRTYSNSPAIYPFQMVMIYELLDEPYLHKQGVDESQFGLFSVTQSGGKYVLGSPKPEHEELRSLFAH
jgi:hypothetical protein